MRDLQSYLYIANNIKEAGLLSGIDLEHFEERHKISITQPPLHQMDAILMELQPVPVQGVILCLDKGLLASQQIRLIKVILLKGYTVWLYWPREQAIERFDKDRLMSQISCYVLSNKK